MIEPSASEFPPHSPVNPLIENVTTGRYTTHNVRSKISKQYLGINEPVLIDQQHLLFYEENSAVLVAYNRKKRSFKRIVLKSHMTDDRWELSDHKASTIFFTRIYDGCSPRLSVFTKEHGKYKHFIISADQVTHKGAQIGSIKAISRNTFLDIGEGIAKIHISDGTPYRKGYVSLDEANYLESSPKSKFQIKLNETHLLLQRYPKLYLIEQSSFKALPMKVEEGITFDKKTTFTVQDGTFHALQFDYGTWAINHFHLSKERVWKQLPTIKMAREKPKKLNAYVKFQVLDHQPDTHFFSVCCSKTIHEEKYWSAPYIYLLTTGVPLIFTC